MGGNSNQFSSRQFSNSFSGLEGVLERNFKLDVDLWDFMVATYTYQDYNTYCVSTETFFKSMINSVVLLKRRS